MTRYPADVRTAVGGLPPLAPGGCQVWWVRVEDVRPEHDDLLDDEDLRRRARLRCAGDRLRTTAAWAVTRLVLGGLAGMPPATVRVDRACPACGAGHGKPRLAAALGLHLSVSHAAGLAVLAVGRDGPVGVDVERIGPWAGTELDEVARLVLTPAERAVLARQHHEDRPRLFTTYWTRKEAVVKATGAGLAAPLDAVEVSPPADPPRVLRWGAQAAPPVVGLAALGAPAGFVSTLAVLDAPTPRVAEFDAGPLLRRYSSRRLPSPTTRSQR